MVDTQRPRTGPVRDPQARAEILAAALDLAAEDIERFSVDALAASAGVGKQTIYRWWPSKWAVLLEALLDRATTDVRSEGGTARRRIASFMTSSFVSLDLGVGPVLRSLMAEAQRDPQFGKVFREQFIAPRRSALRQLLIECGTAHADADAVTDMLFGAMWYRLLIGHLPLDAVFARRLARLAVPGPSEPISPE